MPLKTLDEATTAIRKAYGDNAGGKGYKFPSFPRLPSGILTLDVALAGGIPIGATTLMWGNESSGKTSLCLRLAAQFQKYYPDRKVVWIDVENSWDEQWVKLHGVNVDEVYLFKPTTAEECADVAKEAGMSADAGLIVVDSIAALASIAQLEKSAEEVVVSGYAKQATNMLRALGSAATEHAKAGQNLTVLYINQPRMQIGFTMGNPEILPGPKLQHFQAFLKLRLTGKPVLKEKVAPVAIYSDMSARVAKKKFPCIRQNAEWQMGLYPYKGGTKKNPVIVKPLDVNNWRHLENLLTTYGFLVKNGKEWELTWTGEVFPSKTAAVDAALADYDGTLDFLVDEMLLLYKDDIEEYLNTGEDMQADPHEEA